MFDKIKKEFGTENDHPSYGALEILKYIGPGLLVTVGFIDPGNWAANLAAGSMFGYKLLWMVTLSTLMLIVLQHNVAHLGIATGECLAETANRFLPKIVSRTILSTALLAMVSTSLAEILGGAIALNMLFKLNVKIGATFMLVLVLWMLFSNSYQKLERWIIGFVSIIGISFLVEISIAKVDWVQAAVGSVAINFPNNSIMIIMSVLGAVVMPHNIFLHSEVIQSRQWNKENKAIIEKQLKFEFLDTLFSMGIGWAINCAIIILAASAFFKSGIVITELSQAQQLLVPILGKASAVIFAGALLFSGISSTITAGMAGGTVVAGIFGEPYDLKDFHTKIGVAAILSVSTGIIFLIKDPFMSLVYSQMLLSVQLPITIFLQIYLTSSKRVMGEYKNGTWGNISLLSIGAAVTVLNILLFVSFFKR